MLHHREIRQAILLESISFRLLNSYPVQPSCKLITTLLKLNQHHKAHTRDHKCMIGFLKRRSTTMKFADKITCAVEVQVEMLSRRKVNMNPATLLQHFCSKMTMKVWRKALKLMTNLNNCTRLKWWAQQNSQKVLSSSQVYSKVWHQMINWSSNHKSARNSNFSDHKLSTQIEDRKLSFWQLWRIENIKSIIYTTNI